MNIKASTRAVGAALLALASVPAALAQGAGSSVQVYGQVTAALTHRNNQTGGASLDEVSQSLLAASLLGFRGTEDIGGGLGAVYRLEAGISTDVGTIGAPVGATTKFWNRQSFVGLNFGPMATLTVGRQFHAATDRVIQSLDLYNVGGTSLAVTPLALFGVNRFVGNDARVDDSVKLRLRGPAGMTAGVSAGFNETGAGRKLGSYSLDLAQVTPNYSVAGYYINFESPTLSALGSRPQHTAWGVGGNLPLGPVTVYLHYMDSKVDPSAVGRVEQTNKITHVGVNWMAAPQVSVKAGLYHDKGRALNGVVGRDGNKDTLLVSAEYFLSKRTSVHALVARNSYSDGYKLEPTNIAALGRNSAASSTTWLSAGIRHDF